MIQAGTITIGSGRTRSVAGAYWMISARRVRRTTLPGVTATVSPTLNASVPRRRRAASRSRQVGEPVRVTAHQVGARLGARARQDLRVGPDEIRGSDGVEELPRREICHVVMALADAAHMRCRCFPPAFDRQKVVSVDVERKSSPVRRTKAIIVRQCALGWVARRAGRGLSGKGQIVRGSSDRLSCQFGLLAGRERKMSPTSRKKLLPARPAKQPKPTFKI